MATWWLTWRLTLGLLLAGAAHALSFAPDPLPAWVLSPLELATMAWLAHCVWRAPNALKAAWRAGLFALAHFVVGVYWLTISMHTYGLMPLPLAWLAFRCVHGKEYQLDEFLSRHSHAQIYARHDRHGQKAEANSCFTAVEEGGAVFVDMPEA